MDSRTLNASEWETMRGHAEAVDPPLDLDIIDVVVALNLLGLPTVASCAGHPDEPFDEHGNLSYPYIALIAQMPSRFYQLDHRDPRRWTKRERDYIAARTWRTHRRWAGQLRQLVEDWSQAAGCAIDFEVSADWRGVKLQPKHLAALLADDDLGRRHLGELHDQMLMFGVFLRHRLIGVATTQAVAGSAR
jgi:hypothetical protein